MKKAAAPAWRPRIPSLSRTRWIGTILSLGSLVALGMLLSGSDWRAMLAPSEPASPQMLLVALMLALSVEVAKGVRWQLLLGLPFSALPGLLALLFTSRLLNALVPARAGDLWRVASANRGEGRPLLLAGGSVVAEKLLDGATLAALAALLLRSSTGSPPPTAIMAVLPAIAAAAVAALMGQSWWRSRMPGWTGDLSPLYSPSVLWASAALTLVGLGLGLAVNLAVLNALGLSAGVTLGVAMLVSGYAAGLIPSAPAQMGVYELAVAAPLTALGVPPSSAVAAALTLHLVMIAMLGVGGVAATAIGALRGARGSFPRNLYHGRRKRVE